MTNIQAVIQWSAEPPTEQGWYWHWWNVESGGPVPIIVLYSGTSDTCFVSMGQLGIERAIDCAEYGGFWMPLVAPEVPR